MTVQNFEAQADAILAEATTKISVALFEIVEVEGLPHLNNTSYGSWREVNNQLDTIQASVGDARYISVGFKLLYVDGTVYTGSTSVLSYALDDEYSGSTFLHNHIEKTLKGFSSTGRDNGKSQYHLDHYDIGC